MNLDAMRSLATSYLAMLTAREIRTRMTGLG
jgi:hypothetical protein